MINRSDVEKAENLERRAWELACQVNSAHIHMMSVVHDTAQKRRQALAREMRLAASGKPNPARLAYVRARSSVLQARLKLQLSRSAQQLQALQAAIAEFSSDVDLGPLLDSCPE